MTATRSLIRRLAALVATLASMVTLAVVLAGPASAEQSEFWQQAPPQSPIRTILILGGVPVALFLIIAAAVYLPAIARGERVKPGAAPVEDQWLGGPRRAADELAGPDTEASQAGGAGTRW